jgi:uncharacterized protein
MAAKVLVRNTCSRATVESGYEPLIEAAIRIYHTVFGDELVDVRLMGSVARGEAVAGQSDIDLLALLRVEPEPATLEQLGAHEEVLRDKFPIVGRVDLEAEFLNGLSEFRRFVLASDSISLSGADRFSRPRQYVDRARLARLVTPDPHRLIRQYRAGIEPLDAEREPDVLTRYARVIGKDLLRCLRQAVILRGGKYEKNVSAIFSEVTAHVPEHRLLADALYGLYRHPRADKEVLLRVLDLAEERLEPNG